MKKTITLTGYASLAQANYKRIKIVYTYCTYGGEWTFDFIKKMMDPDIHCPVTDDGFWVKFNKNTKYKNLAGDMCELNEIIDKHVEIVGSVTHYSYENRQGFYISAKELRVVA